MLRTWLPMFGYCASAAQLSDKLLKKQIIDTRTILETLDALASDNLGVVEKDEIVIWGWAGHERSLCIYGSSCAYEWRVKRKLPGGFSSGIWFSQQDEKLKDLGPPYSKLLKPPWVEDKDVCRSHRSRLIVLNEKRYGLYWPNNPTSMPTLWPQNVVDDSRGYRLRLSQGDIIKLSRGDLILPDWLYFDKNKKEVLNERNGE